MAQLAVLLRSSSGTFTASDCHNELPPECPDVGLYNSAVSATADRYLVHSGDQSPSIDHVTEVHVAVAVKVPLDGSYTRGVEPCSFILATGDSTPCQKEQCLRGARAIGRKWYGRLHACQADSHERENGQ